MQKSTGRPNQLVGNAPTLKELKLIADLEEVRATSGRKGGKTTQNGAPQARKPTGAETMTKTLGISKSAFH